MAFIGLTGGFGTGKTTILNLFKKFGAYTINVDELVHDLLKKTKIIKKVVSIFGEDILLRDSSGRLIINKKEVADIIFNNSQKRKAIERIIHPEIFKTLEDIKTTILKRDPSAMIICEVPLLFEAGYEKNFDKVIVVYCTTNTAIKRLSKRGFTKTEILKRMRAQMSLTKKKALADFLIDNNNGIRRTETQVKQIFYKLRSELT